MNPHDAATHVPAEAPLNASDFPPCQEVIMVGTSADQVRGGIGAVVRGYREAGFFARFPITYITTHREGSPRGKVLAALGAYTRLCRELATANAPLIHIHLSRGASFWRKSVVCVFALVWRRPYVLHVHTGRFGNFYDEDCGVIAKAMVRQALRRAAAVLVLSEHWRTTLLRICSDARVRTLPNSVVVPPERSGADPDPAAPRILCTGRISEAKGTFDLLRAFARVAPRYPGAVLICAGDGQGPQLLELAASMGLSGRVACPGWLSAEEIRKEMEQATVWALPSHSEGVPMAMLEAMALGLPVVVTPVGGIPEVVQNGRNGVLVAPRDIDAIGQALLALLESPSERARLGAAARETIVRHFTLSATLDKLAALYLDFGLRERQA
jgi:glycosyltransferase involved in cell wall biosynthesis